MNLWLDDIRHPVEAVHFGWRCDLDWTRCKSVADAVHAVTYSEDEWMNASLDHDLGAYSVDGGDGINLVKWMATHNIWPALSVRVHSFNPVGKQNMLSDIDRYGPYTIGGSDWRGV